MGIKLRTDALRLEEEMSVLMEDACIGLDTTPSHREANAGGIQHTAVSIRPGLRSQKSGGMAQQQMSVFDCLKSPHRRA